MSRRRGRHGRRPRRRQGDRGRARGERRPRGPRRPLVGHASRRRLEARRGRPPRRPRSSATSARPTILVNAAGIFGPIARVVDGDPQAWLDTIAIDLGGPYLCSRAFLPGMLREGFGRIISLSSAASLHPPGGFNSAYGTAKVALNQFTRHLAAELEGTGVTANVIHPGDVKTEMWADIRDQVAGVPGRERLPGVGRLGRRQRRRSAREGGGARAADHRARRQRPVPLDRRSDPGADPELVSARACGAGPSAARRAGERRESISRSTRRPRASIRRAASRQRPRCAARACAARAPARRATSSSTRIRCRLDRVCVVVDHARSVAAISCYSQITMPFEEPLLLPPKAHIQPSAAIELSWLVIGCGNRSAVHTPGRTASSTEADVFWGDGERMLTEVLVIAEQLGCVTGWDIEPLLHVADARDRRRGRPRPRDRAGARARDGARAPAQARARSRTASALPGVPARGLGRRRTAPARARTPDDRARGRPGLRVARARPLAPRSDPRGAHRPRGRRSCR